MAKPSTHRRGQAAFELIMTYGWAILAAIVAISAVAYFTGFYAKLLPNNCSTVAPFVCVEYKVTKDGTVALGIQNGAGIDTSNVNLTVQCNQDPAQEVSQLFPLVRGQERLGGNLATFTCPIEGASFKAKLFITYTLSGENVPHTVTGDMRVAVE